jgi:Cu2+-exporting ATPase
MTTAAIRWESYDAPALRRRLLQVQDGLASAQVDIEGMHCANCARRIEEALTRVDGVKSVAINRATHRLQLTWDLERARFSRLLRTIAALGFRPIVPNGVNEAAQRLREQRVALKRLAAAGIAMAQVMTFAFGLYAGALQGIESRYAEYLRLVSMLVTVPVVLYSAVPFFAGAWRDLAGRRVGMDVPVSLAIAAAFLASVYNTLRGTGHVYFDSVTMFVFLLLLGRFIEMRTRHHAGSVSDALARLIPPTAQRLHDGRVEAVPVYELAADDVIVIAAGAVIPADGVVIEGASQVDESLLTGESTPLARSAGLRVIGGSLNLSGPLQVRLTAVGPRTVIAGIVRLLERAQTERPRVARAADRVAAHFVAWILLGALAVYALWLWLDPPRAFPATLAVLVVTCPCALSLATPTVIAAATSRLARAGLLVTRADAIENLARAKRWVFDKTGTLTQGAPRIARRHTLGVLDADACSRIAAAIEQASGHPLAAAFQPYAHGAIQARNARVFPGRGVEGEIDGTHYRIGQLDFVGELGTGMNRPESVPEAAIFLANPSGLLAAYEMDDAVRLGAAAAIRELQVLGLQTELASGDHAEPVARVARELGIAAWYARLTPEAKLEHVRALGEKPGGVAMVGDGINDAPVLAAASVSVAMGGGSALAHASADLILMSESLATLAEAVPVARTALRIMRQNLFWAAAYNLLAIPLAALGWVPPWAAAIGMSASSVLVVLNAQRIAWIKVRPPRASPAVAPATEPAARRELPA